MRQWYYIDVVQAWSGYEKYENDSGIIFYAKKEKKKKHDLWNRSWYFLIMGILFENTAESNWFYSMNFYRVIAYEVKFIPEPDLKYGIKVPVNKSSST